MSDAIRDALVRLDFAARNAEGMVTYEFGMIKEFDIAALRRYMENVNEARRILQKAVSSG
jgi:hypothetical protein